MVWGSEAKVLQHEIGRRRACTEQHALLHGDAIVQDTLVVRTHDTRWPRRGILELDDLLALSHTHTPPQVNTCLCVCLPLSLSLYRKNYLAGHVWIELLDLNGVIRVHAKRDLVE